MWSARHSFQLLEPVKARIPRAAALRYLAAAICAYVLIRYLRRTFVFVFSSCYLSFIAKSSQILNRHRRNLYASIVGTFKTVRRTATNIGDFMFSSSSLASGLTRDLRAYVRSLLISNSRFPPYP